MRLRLAFLALLPLTGLVYACGDDDDNGASPTPTPIADAGPLVDATADAADAEPVDAGPVAFSIPFDARINGTTFKCGQSYPNVGTANTTVTPQDMRFFVYDVKLDRAGSGVAVPITLTPGAMQSETLALLDFEDKTGGCTNGTAETNTTLTGTAPAGTYDAIEFVVGVPPTLINGNPDTAPVPLLGSKLQWGWNAGYIFFSLGLTPVPASTPPTFFAHVGSSACTGNANIGEPVTCTRANRMKVRLTGLDLARSKIVLDLEKLFTGSDVTTNDGVAGGCMSDPTDKDCPPVLTRLGLALGSGTSTSNPVIFGVAPR